MIQIAVFLDSGFLLGLCHPKDKYAKVSEEILKRLSTSDQGLLYISDFIISEVTTLVAVRSGNDIKVLEHLGKLIWGNERIVTVLQSSSEIVLDSWKLFKKVNAIDLKGKGTMSFVDITSVILCKNHQIDSIVSFDPHFDRFLIRIYR